MRNVCASMVDIKKKGRSLYVNAFNASKYLFAIMIILLTRFLVIF